MVCYIKAICVKEFLILILLKMVHNR